MRKKTAALLRIEVPFCVRPCGWRPNCAVIPGWDSGRQQRYLQALCAEIESNAAQFADLRIVAVRFGGGVASNLGEGIDALMRALRSNYDLASDAPVTMRSSFSNISGANMTWFKRAGITRYDFELMSLCQNDFAFLNQTDSLSDVQTICDYILRPCTNKMLGLILAFGMRSATPGRTLQNFRDSIIRFTRSHAVHLVLLRYQGEAAASSDETAEQLAQGKELLARADFQEYLPLHFARQGQEDSYFLARHSGVPELAFGLGARSRIDGVVSTNTSDLASYLQHSADFTRITASIESAAALQP